MQNRLNLRPAKAAPTRKLQKDRRCWLGLLAHKHLFVRKGKMHPCTDHHINLADRPGKFHFLRLF